VGFARTAKRNAILSTNRQKGTNDMMRDSSTFTCPKCGRKQKFLADEWPDPCICGYDADEEVSDVEFMRRIISKTERSE